MRISQAVGRGGGHRGWGGVFATRVTPPTVVPPGAFPPAGVCASWIDKIHEVNQEFRVIMFSGVDLSQVVPPYTSPTLHRWSRGGGGERGGEGVGGGGGADPDLR